MSVLQNKINSAIRILKIAEQQASLSNQPVEIAYSGGKDSDVLLQLAKESEINYKAIYKNTTIDPAGTIQHVRENNVEIRQPKIPFFKLIEKKGFPSFRFRFCCAHLKEYKILDTACFGVRADESIKRKKLYSKGFNFCRVYNSKEKVNVFTPISDWSLENVKQFIIDRNLKLASCYYDNDGKIDFSRRLGCVGCPLKYDRGIKDFLKNPKYLKAWLKAGNKYFIEHYSNNKLGFNDAYELFIFRTFYHDTSKFFDAFKSLNIFNIQLDAKKILEDYFNVELP